MIFLHAVLTQPFSWRTMASNRVSPPPVGAKQAELVALEVNQAAQDWRASVPLISHKATVVRAHLQSLTTKPVEVRGVLRGFRNGVEFPDSPRKPTNPGGFVYAQVNAAAFRGTVASSLNFFLPLNWCTGAVNLRFESTNVECGEATGAPDHCETSVTFQSVAVPQVTFLRVKWLNGGSFGEPRAVSVTQEQTQELADRLRAIYPIERLDWNAPEMTWTNTGVPTLEALLPYVDYLRIWNQDRLGDKRLWYGVLSGNQDGGLAYQGGESSAGWMSAPGDRFGRNRHAHELGHNLGLDHPTLALLGTNARGERLGYCGEVAGGNNPDFPFFESLNGQIKAVLGPLSSGEDKKIYGYDAHEGKMVDPLRAAELMSYCDLPDGRWVSSFTYTNLLARIDSRFADLGRAASGVARTSPETYLVVRGTIDQTNDGVTFAPFAKLSAISAPARCEDGAYSVRNLTASGAVVSNNGFALSKMDSDSPHTSGTIGSFTIALKDNPDVKSISILRDHQVIATQAASPNAPQVRILAPNGGENIVGDPVMVQWTASDSDGDPLVYIVQYSPDNGSSWITLAVDWPEQSYEADFASLPASEQALMRVMVSDGFNTGADQSDAPFGVANHPPHIQIAQPADQQIALGDQELIFQASAHDVEDGEIPDANIQWQSSLDGVLGRGPIFSRSATSLSEGAHVITATARDSANATGSALIHVTVSRSVPAAFADLVLGQAKATDNESDLIITIENQGPSQASALQVTNALPTGAEVFAVSSSSGECIVTNGTIVCAIDQLAVGASVIIHLQLDLPAPGVYTNVVSVAAAELDPSPGNNVAAQVIEFAPAMPQLQIDLVGATVNISWPATTPPNTVLHSSPTLFPGDWTDVTEPATVVNGRFNVFQEITTKTRFFRLERH